MLAGGKELPVTVADRTIAIDIGGQAPDKIATVIKLDV
jgi:hypothetical protein